MRRTFTSGNIAVAEGALTAGLKFYAGYPITPSSEIMEYLSEKLPSKGGVVVQMEDEIGSINAIIGASWAGAKAMTATSGPGFSLMAEAMGLAVITETPIVVVNVMRAGPSTGVPTKTSQSDVLQARWLAHGDYLIPCYAPWSVQEAYDLTIKAFNTAELLRTPAVVLSDAVIAHLWEPLTLHEPGEVEIINRKTPLDKQRSILPYKPDPDLIPPMPIVGHGYKTIIESLTHDEKGYYSPKNADYRALIKRLTLKILKRIDYIYDQDTRFCEDADLLLVSYGSTARSVYLAALELRRKGIKAGFLRLKTLWPLHEEKIRNSCKAKKIIVIENNMGKIYFDIDRIFKDRDVYSSPVLSLDLPTPREILEVIEPWL
ncbi:MAG: 2-oxoacid:acceptor oxidoreductase subunit alpha [Desulfurococcaceae archaeon]